MENLKSEKVLTAKELASYFDHTLFAGKCNSFRV